MKKNIIRKTNYSEQGFGLIEVIIAAAILSVVALGITTLIEDMMRMQKKNNTVGVINRMRGQIRAAVQNGRSWELTAADATVATGNPYMDCIRPGATTCTHDVITPLNLKDADGNPVYYGVTAGHGFTYDGVYCTTYPSDACPFRWNLTWTAKCSSAPTILTCREPNVIVTGRLEYTPGTSGILPGGFNPNLYRIDVTRGAEAIRNDAVTVSYVEGDASGEGDGCDAAWVTRQLNTVDGDPGNNLLNKSGAVLLPLNQVQLRAGTYNCRVQSPGFKNGGNRLRLRSTAGTAFPTVTSPVGTAMMAGGSVNLIIDTTLVLNADSTFVVEQKCTSRPLAAPAENNAPHSPAIDFWSLGVPVPSAPGPGGYTNTVYTTVSCARTS